MVNLMTMVAKRIKQESVWITRYHRETGAVECFKARGKLMWTSEPNGVFAIHWMRRSGITTNHGVLKVERTPCYDTIERGNWHRTEAKALARVKVLIKQRQCRIARETSALYAMMTECIAERLPITRKR